jgi:hypothetical protein
LKFRDITRLQLEDTEMLLQEALEGISDVEARWQPAPTSNHILWILWHLSRIEDVWFNDYMTTGSDVWVNSGWYERIGRPKDAHGFGDSIEDVVGFPDVPLSEIHGYRAAVRESIWPVLDGLTQDDLANTFEERWPLARAAPTVTWALGRVVVEASQHIGQIAYIAGMIRDARK